MSVIWMLRKRAVEYAHKHSSCESPARDDSETQLDSTALAHERLVGALSEAQLAKCDGIIKRSTCGSAQERRLKPGAGRSSASSTYPSDELQ